MLKSLCIMDQNRAYAGLLAEHLTRHFGGLIEISIAEYEANATSDSDLILRQYFPASDFHSHRSNTVLIFEDTEEMAIYRSHAAVSQPAFNRDMGITEIARLIRPLLFAEAYAVENARLTLLHGFRDTVRRIKRTECLREYYADGLEIFYFPLMSPYQWDLPLTFHDGPDLSTLHLLSERASRIDFRDFTAIFQYQDGYWTPKPGQGEDFYYMQDKNILEIIKLFRIFLEKRTSRCVGLIECCGLSLKLVEQIALLCDHLIVDLYESDSYGSIEARRVWSRMIGNLPNHIHVSPAISQLRMEESR